MGGCAGSWEECRRSGICISKLGTGAIAMALQTGMELLATLCSGLFAVAAVSINAVEPPARMSCGVEAAVAEWAPSYHRATGLQAPLAVVGLAVPFTLVVILPTNRRLESGLGEDPEETRTLLER